MTPSFVSEPPSNEFADAFHAEGTSACVAFSPLAKPLGTRHL